MRTSSTGVGKLLVTLSLLLALPLANAALPSHPAVHTFEPTAAEYPLSAAGYGVAIRNGTALLGMVGIEKVAIFTRNSDGKGWQRTGTINAPAGALSFGRLISYRDNTMVVGDTFAAYVYKLVNGRWQYTQKLNVGTYDDPLTSLAYEDNMVVAGHSRWDSPGRVLVFQLNAQGKLVRTTTLRARDAQPGDSFGYDVAMSSTGIVVGAPYSGAGAAYMFRRTSSGWVQSQRLSNAQSQYEGFGWSVCIDKGIVVVGAPYEDFQEGGDFENPTAAEGAAYIFRANSSGTFVQSQRLRPSSKDVSNFTSFGEDIQKFDNRIVIAGKELTFAPGRYAESQVFTYTFTNGTAVPHGFTSMFQAASFALANNWLMVGQPFDIAGGGGGMATLIDLNRRR